MSRVLSPQESVGIARGEQGRIRVGVVPTGLSHPLLPLADQG
jgi:hypothetical protein